MALKIHNFGQKKGKTVKFKLYLVDLFNSNIMSSVQRSNLSPELDPSLKIWTARRYFLNRRLETSPKTAVLSIRQQYFYSALAAKATKSILHQNLLDETNENPPHESSP
jgi:hypothetical protein